MRQAAAPENILMLNLTRMGDLIQSTPLLKGVREQYPAARITLLVGRDFYEFSKRLPCVDRTLVLDLRQFNDGRKGKIVNWVEIYKYFEQTLNPLRDEKFDLAFNLSHSKLSAFILSYLKIANIRGFRCNSRGERQTDHPWMQYFFTEPFNRDFNTFNLVDLFSRAGDLPDKPRSLEIRSAPEDTEKLRPLLQQYGIGDSEFLIGMQAGSSLKGRRWPPANFSRLADQLISRHNARIVLLGVASESDIAGEIVQRMEFPDRVIDLTGKTGIDSLIGMVGRLDYLVTNDTGTMHIAAALDTPVAGLFFAHAHPHETGPYAPGHLIFQADIPCAPCSYGIECNDVVCVRKVSPELVFNMIGRHRRSGNWSLPENGEHLEGVRCFVTEFDRDHCLRMRRLNPAPLETRDLFAWAYRRLWLDTLNTEAPATRPVDGTVEFLRSSYRLPVPLETWQAWQALRRTGEELLVLAERGVELAGSILTELAGPRPSHERLSRAGDRITALDDQISQVGLTRPEWKPITDLFNKRKENIDGTDVRQMANETRQCYRKMKLECEMLSRIIEEIRDRLGRQAAWGEDVSSMRMEVPGR